MSKSYYSLENTAPKMKGAGDGLKTAAVRPSERVPVPSSRKFTATPVRDPSVQFRLKKALDDIDTKQGKLKKAKSVAEITPTKNKTKTPKRNDAGSAVVLHATPRSPVGTVKKAPFFSRYNQERRRQLRVYGRMLLLVWRRSKTRQAILSESLRRRQEQIQQLEKQVSCLKDLNKSECDKRNEAINERQSVECILETLRTENESLEIEKCSSQNEINSLKNILQNTHVELQNIRNEVNSKNVYLKRLESEVQTQILIIDQLNKEETSNICKMKEQLGELKLRDEDNQKLTQRLQILEEELMICKAAKQAIHRDYDKLFKQFQIEIEKNQFLQSNAKEMRQKIDDIEEKLTNMSNNFVQACNENDHLKKILNENMYWWKNAKEFATVSWVVLQNVLYTMLPAL